MPPPTNTPPVAPIFRARVVPPFQPELAKTALDGALGASVALEGQIHRTPPFAGEVEVKLEGMPMGVSAVPVVVPATQSAFKILLASAVPAKPGRAELKLVATAKLGDAKKPTVYAAPALAFGYTIHPAARPAEAARPAGGGAQPSEPKGDAGK